MFMYKVCTDFPQQIISAIQQFRLTMNFKSVNVSNSPITSPMNWRVEDKLFVDNQIYK